MQPALPSTFRNLLASWQSAVEDARARLAAVQDHSLAVQLGGPIGELDDPELVRAFAAELGLAVPERSWHTVRTRVVDVATALGLTIGALGKIGADVIVLSQREIGELEEGAAGASSSMPDKRNAARSVQLVALAQRGPGLVATVFAALPQELHRAAGRWQSEDAAIRELLVLAGKAAHHAVTLLEGLRVFPDRMKANLDA
jgi:3-carboxy-cis,cis-muconate cycloisomerase